MSQAALDIAAQAAAQAPASAPFAAPTVSSTAAASGVAGAGEVTLALILVLLAIFACAWVVKRMRTFGRAQSRTLAILDDLPVGQKERVVLIGVGAQRLLVGVAPGRVSLLQTLPDEVGGVVADATFPTAPVSASSPDFKSLLRKSLGLS